jgi:hypothetical protein
MRWLSAASGRFATFAESPANDRKLREADDWTIDLSLAVTRRLPLGRFTPVHDLSRPFSCVQDLHKARFRAFS